MFGWVSGGKLIAAVFGIIAVSAIVYGNSITPTPSPPSVLNSSDSAIPNSPIVSFVNELQVIPFQLLNQEDPTLTKGLTRIKVYGVNGEKKINYKLTTANNTILSKEVISELITKNPVNQIVLIGTYVAPSFNYGPTALCRDGTYSYSANHQGTCSHHGGVAEWYR